LKFQAKDRRCFCCFLCYYACHWGGHKKMSKKYCTCRSTECGRSSIMMDQNSLHSFV